MLSTFLKLKTKIKFSGASSYLLAICSSHGGALQCFVEVALKLSTHHRMPISSIASSLRVLKAAFPLTGLSAQKACFIHPERKHFSDWNRSLNEGNRLVASSLF